MADKGNYIVFLDLDKTILGVNTGYALIRQAVSERAIGPVGMIKAIFYTTLYKLKLLSPARFIPLMGGWLKGMDQSFLLSLSESANSNYLADAVFPGALAEINFHKGQNAETAILSSAISEICTPLAASLGIDYVICTEMETTGGKLTGLTKGKYCYGDEKASRISAFCLEKGFNAESAWYYADSYSDISALEAVGNPVCVNPDSALRRMANTYGWPVKDWKL